MAEPMGLTRFLIEELTGVDRNAAEGEGLAPREVRNMHFDRRGGLVVFGGRRGDRFDAALPGTPLAWDEGRLVLFDDLQLWVDDRAESIDFAPFNLERLTLVPGVGLLSRFSRVGEDYAGAAYYLNRDDALTVGPVPTGITTSQTSGTDVPQGDYFFLVTLEAPTVNGLLSYETIVIPTVNVADPSGAGAIILELDSVLPPGHVVRFYYRRTVQTTYDNFAVRVSNGELLVTARLEGVTPFVETADVKMNFAPGRVEPHLGRVWGQSSLKPFAGYFSAASFVVVGGHLLRPQGVGLSTVTHSAPVTLANAVMRAFNDRIDIDIRQLYVRRLTNAEPTVVDLFDVREGATPNRRVFARLTWQPNVTTPTVDLFLATGTTAFTLHRLASIAIPTGLALGTAAGSSDLTITNNLLSVRLGTIAQEASTGRINSTVAVELIRPAGTVSEVRTVQALPAPSARTPPVANQVSGSTYQQTTDGGDTLSAWTNPSHFVVDSVDANRYVQVTVSGSGGQQANAGIVFSEPRYIETVDVSVTYDIDGTPLTSRTLQVIGPDGNVNITVSTSAFGQTVNVGRRVTALVIQGSPVFRGSILDPPPVHTMRIRQLRPYGSRASAWSGWSAWVGGGAQILSLGAIPSAFTPGLNSGARDMQARAITAARLATDQADGRILDYTPPGTTWVSLATGETWAATSADYLVTETQSFEAPDEAVIARPETTLVYSEVGSVNRGSVENFLELRPISSSGITALASTPAGLVVFMENETFLVRGDPLSPDFSAQRLSGTLGNDRNVVPGRLGGVVFPIYKGQVYAIALGMGDVDFGSGIDNISLPVWKPEDPFVQVVGEPQTNHIVCLTQSGRIYRYDATRQAWFNDPYDLDDSDASEGGNGVRFILPAAFDQTYGSRYLVGEELQVMDLHGQDPPRVSWGNLDVGDKHTDKLWRRVEVATNREYVGPPVLEFIVRGNGSQAAAFVQLEGDFDAPLVLEGGGSMLTLERTNQVVGVSTGDGRWVFSLRRGRVGAVMDMRLILRDFTRNDVLEAPLAIEVARRSRPRGRVR